MTDTSGYLNPFPLPDDPKPGLGEWKGYLRRLKLMLPGLKVRENAHIHTLAKNILLTGDEADDTIRKLADARIATQAHMATVRLR